MDARKSESGGMESAKQQFLQSHVLLDAHKYFLEDFEVRQIDKTQSSYLTKREYQQMRTLKNLNPDDLNFERNYQLPLCPLGYTCSLAT